MKRVLAVTALVLSALGAVASPAHAGACVTAHVQVNDQVVDQAQCV